MAVTDLKTFVDQNMPSPAEIGQNAGKALANMYKEAEAQAVVSRTRAEFGKMNETMAAIKDTTAPTVNRGTGRDGGRSL